jgi:flagellar biosynthesis protein FliR
MLREICKISLQMLKQFLTHTYCIPVHLRFCQGLRQNLHTQILLLSKFLFLFSSEIANIILLRTWDSLTPLVWEMFDNMWQLDNEHSFWKVLVAVGNVFHKAFQFFLPIITPSVPCTEPVLLNIYSSQPECYRLSYEVWLHLTWVNVYRG